MRPSDFKSLTACGLASVQQHHLAIAVEYRPIGLLSKGFYIRHKFDPSLFARYCLELR
jgi:hypothetical protein